MTPREVITGARQALRTAELGYRDAVGDDPSRRISGITNAIVFGRSVTNVIYKLVSRVDNFETWYREQTAEMGADSGFHRLYKMRSEILKEGAVSTGIHVRIGYIDDSLIHRMRQDAPPGAGDLFVGDETGGSGFLMTLPDGTTEKYYMAMPERASITSTLTVTTADGEQLDVGPLLDRYLARMRKFIDDAERRFAIQ